MSGMSGMMGAGSMGGRDSGGMPGGLAAIDPELNPKYDPDMKQYFDAPKFMFKLQLIWKPQPLTARLAAKRAAEEAAAAEAATAEEAPDDLADNAR